MPASLGEVFKLRSQNKTQRKHTKTKQKKIKLNKGKDSTKIYK